jgi:putative ABC transport system permease protein
VRVAEGLRVALEALRSNRLRSVLTMLGVIIGVAAVVTLVAIGTGTKRQIEAQVEGLGSNLLLVVPGEFQTAQAPTQSRLRMDDVDAVTRLVGDRRRVTAQLTSGEELRAGTKNTFATVYGVLDTTLNVVSRKVERGTYFTRGDVDTRRRVVVLGSSSAHRLFGDEDPIGRQVSIAGVRFRVIGVMAPVGASLGVDQDLNAHIPITAANMLFGTDRIDSIAVKASSHDDVAPLGHRIERLLEARHPDSQFSAVTQEQILGILGKILSMLTFVLAAIAGISLLVGGVGVSNIMLVSVRERTREIGLRKAVGAKPRDITVQFLLEAVLLTTLGGVIGILLGGTAAIVVDRLSPVPAAIAWWSPALAFGVSAAVGIFFGVVPARRAGRLDPVIALRSE